MILQRELVIIPQRMPFPVVGEQDTRQLRMTGEAHAGEIVNLTLVPIRGGPDRRDRGNFRQFARLVVLPARQDQLDHEAMAMREALQMIDNLEVRLEPGFGRLLGIGLEVIDAADATQQLEAELRLVAQEAGDLN